MPTPPRFTLDAHVHANGVILGGILSDFYRFYHRSYNWASGFSLKFGLHGSFLQERLTVSLEDQFYRLYSWNGWDMDKDWSQTPAGEPVDVQGDCSRGTFNHFEARVRCRLWKRLYATACMDLYKRQTLYPPLHGISGRILRGKRPAHRQPAAEPPAHAQLLLLIPPADRLFPDQCPRSPTAANCLPEELRTFVSKEKSQ